MEEATQERVKKVIQEISGLGEKLIVPEASLVDDLGLDSLDKVDLTMELEEEFKITISDEEIGAITTVDGINKYIEKKIGQENC